MAANKEQREIEIVMNGQKIEASLKDMQRAAGLMNGQLRQMSADDPNRKKLIKDFHEMKERIGAMKQELYGVEKASLMAKLGFNDMGGLMKTVMGTAGGFLVGGGVEAIIGKVVGFFGASSTAAKDFETAISNLSAITGATGEDLRFYEEQAQLIGETTSLSAIQAVEAFKLIGSAKPELLANKEALAAVTQEAIALAEASGMELPAAADSLTSALNQFGASADDAGRYINVMAAGAKEGSAEIEETAAALKNAGTVAAGANLSFEATNAVIQSLSEISIKGGEAGTGLRNVLLTLQSGADDTNPAVVGLETALDNLGKKNMSTAELAKLFGKENVVVAKQMVDSREKISQLTVAMTGTNTAYEQAATNMDNLEGDTKALSSATESLQITIGNGLNVAIRAGVKLLTSLILGIKEAPAFVRENKEAFIALGVAVLSLNAANIKTAATTLYHTAVEKGRSVATRATAAAQWVLNAAMTANPIGLVVAAVAALVGGFVMLYNRSEAVRGGVFGLFSAFKELMSIAGDVALFLINPIKNAGKIKEIMNAGDRLGKAFSDGFNDKLASEKAAQEKKEAADHQQKKTIANQKGQDLGKATADGFAATLKGKGISQLQEMLETETDASHKKMIQKRIEYLKEIEKKEKEHQEKVKKAREEYNAAVANSDLQNAKLKLDLMQDGIDKTLAKLRFQHEQEKIELQKQRQAVLSNIAVTEEEKQALLNQYAEQQRMKDEEQKLAEAEAIQQDKEAKKETFFSDMEEEEAIKQEALTELFTSSLESEFQREQALLELKKATLEEKRNYLLKNNLLETQEATAVSREILKTDKELAEGKVANEERTAIAKKELARAQMDQAIEGFQIAVDLLGKETVARKAAVVALKAFSLGKIAMDLQEEISAIWKTANQNPLNALIPGSGNVIAGLKTAMAIKRSVTAAKTVTAQEFAAGGMTKGGKTIPMTEIGGMWQMMSGHSGGSIGAFADGGWVNNAQLGLIGERGRELVLPNWMVESPKYANIVGYLESERQKGVRAYAEGGSTGAPIQATASQESGNNQVMLQVLVKLDELKAEISAWPTKLEVHNNVGETRDALKVLNDLEKQAFG